MTKYSRCIMIETTALTITMGVEKIEKWTLSGRIKMRRTANLIHALIRAISPRRMTSMTEMMMTMTQLRKSIKREWGDWMWESMTMTKTINRMTLKINREKRKKNLVIVKTKTIQGMMTRTTKMMKWHRWAWLCRTERKKIWRSSWRSAGAGKMNCNSRSIRKSRKAPTTLKVSPYLNSAFKYSVKKPKE